MLCLSRCFYMHLSVEAMWVWTVFPALFEQLIHIRCCFWIQCLYIMSLRATKFVWKNVTDTKKETKGGRNFVAVLYNINGITVFRASKQWLQALCSDWTKLYIFIRSTMKYAIKVDEQSGWSILARGHMFWISL